MELVHGARKKVKRTTHRPNATLRKASGSTKLKLKGLKAGSHTLKAVVTYTETTKGKTSTFTKTLRTKLKVCAAS
jgi:hypothetical protein